MRLYDVADNRNLLRVTAEQHDELERWTQSRTLPAGDVFRARLILALAEGLSYRDIERRLGASAPTVSLWKGRFEESGVAGLQGQHKVARREPQRRLSKRVSFGACSRNRQTVARTGPAVNLPGNWA